jgi:DNA-binding NarL/FixJ family response regulator
MQSAKTTNVLVARIEPIIGMSIENFLGDLGYSVVGPIENLKAAVLLAATEQIDVAVVDINISGQVATAVADRLIERRIP